MNNKLTTETISSINDFRYYMTNLLNRKDIPKECIISIDGRSITLPFVPPVFECLEDAMDKAISDIKEVANDNKEAVITSRANLLDYCKLAVTIITAYQQHEHRMNASSWYKYCQTAQHIDANGDWHNIEQSPDNLEALINFYTEQVAELSYDNSQPCNFDTNCEPNCRDYLICKDEATEVSLEELVSVKDATDIADDKLNFDDNKSCDFSTDCDPNCRDYLACRYENKIALAKKIASVQFNYLSVIGCSHEPCISFTNEESGQDIVNPWMDSTGRFDIDPATEYDMTQVHKFIDDCNVAGTAYLELITKELADHEAEPTMVTLDDVIYNGSDEMHYDDELVTLKVINERNNSYEISSMTVLAQNVVGCLDEYTTQSVQTVEISNAEYNLIAEAISYTIEQVRSSNGDVAPFAQGGYNVTAEDQLNYAQILENVLEQVTKTMTTDSTDIQVRC